MSLEVSFAILAPVPAEHLESGLEVCERDGFVAFGSNKWEFFPEVDKLRVESTVPVLIYPSYEHEEGKSGFTIRWVGTYVGFIRSDLGAHPEGMKHRPETTKKYANDVQWAVYWHVANLRELDEEAYQPISSLLSYKSGKYWKAGTPPRGPEIVARPKWV